MGANINRMFVQIVAVNVASNTPADRFWVRDYTPKCGWRARLLAPGGLPDL